MDLATRAYIAGYFDGEGCATVRRAPGASPVAAIYFSQRDRLALEAIQRDLGGLGTIYVARTTGTWYLQISRACEIVEFARIVYPYVRQKRTQLRLAYRLARRTGVQGRPVSLSSRDHRRALAEEIFATNQVGRLKPVANRHGSSRFKAVA